MTTSLAVGTRGSSEARLRALYPLSFRMNKGESQLRPDILHRTRSGPAPPQPVFTDSVMGGCRLRPSAKELAKDAARMWLSNPLNKMLLPKNIEVADTDNSGTIDRKEFDALMKAAGGHAADASRVFALADADGDGELSMAEIQALKDKSQKRAPVG